MLLPAPEPASKRPSQMPVVVLLWLVLPAMGIILDSTLRWTNHGQGFMAGAVISVVAPIASLLYGAPWLLAVWAVYRWRRWRRFRFVAMVGPAMGFFLAVPVIWVVDPPEAGGRLREVAGINLPDDAQALRWHHEGPTLASGSSDIWYFEASEESVRRFILELKLERDTQSVMGRESLPMRVPTGWPDPSKWPGLTHYSNAGNPLDQQAVHEIFTDGQAHRVYYLFFNR